MAASKSKGGYHIVMLALSFTIAFLLHLLLFGTAPMVTLIMEEMELSHAEFGLISSLSNIGPLVMPIVFGFLIPDRCHRYVLCLNTGRGTPG